MKNMVYTMIILDTDVVRVFTTAKALAKAIVEIAMDWETIYLDEKEVLKAIKAGEKTNRVYPYVCDELAEYGVDLLVQKVVLE